MIDQVVRSRDGMIRRVVVKYRNSKENFYRGTDRSPRKLIKIWSADDPDLQEDLGKLQTRIDELQGHLDDGILGGNLAFDLGAFAAELDVPTNCIALQEFPDALQLQPRYAAPHEKRCLCCCDEHCAVSIHNCYGSRSYHHPLSTLEGFQLEDEAPEEMLVDDAAQTENEECETDTITALIMSVGVDFS